MRKQSNAVLQLTGEPVDNTAVLDKDDLPQLQQGLMQQETIRFNLPEAVSGLRCVKKYAVGELSWDQTVAMGDFSAGEHEFSFAESTVPTGKLTAGRYVMKTVFMDVHGQYLWAGVNTFQVVPPPHDGTSGRFATGAHPHAAPVGPPPAHEQENLPTIEPVIEE